MVNLITKMDILYIISTSMLLLRCIKIREHYTSRLAEKWSLAACKHLNGHISRNQEYRMTLSQNISISPVMFTSLKCLSAKIFSSSSRREGLDAQRKILKNLIIR